MKENKYKTIRYQSMKNVYLFMRNGKVVAGPKEFETRFLSFICTPEIECDTLSEMVDHNLYPSNNLLDIAVHGGKELTKGQRETMDRLRKMYGLHVGVDNATSADYEISNDILSRLTAQLSQHSNETQQRTMLSRTLERRYKFGIR